jgi:D-alanine-D-alanine ligase-like ATP-grasp enzyme
VTPKNLLSPLAEMSIADIRRELAARLALSRVVGPRATWRALRDDLASARTRDVRRRAVAETLWREAAAEVGAQVSILEPGVLEIRRDNKSTRVIRERVMLNDAVSIEIAEDKRLARRLIADAGIPVPDSCEFSIADGDRAYDFLVRKTPPFVVKPATASGGKGITANVRLPAELRRAATAGTRWDSELILERQAEGDVYRLLVLDGQVIDVLRRDRPGLTGDGESTIYELLLAENRRRRTDPSSLVTLPLDLDCLLTLKAQGMRLHSVPRHGETFTIRTVTNHNGAAENETVDGPISEELRTQAKLATDVLGLRLAALDIVTPDLQLGLKRDAGVVLEVNPVPALYQHYRVADRSRATKVAVPILRRLLE